MQMVRVLIVHNETDSRSSGGDWHGDRFEGFIPSLSRTLRPTVELRFLAEDGVTPEAIANRVWAIGNGAADGDDGEMSDAYYRHNLRSLSIGDLLGVLVLPSKDGTVDTVKARDLDWAAPVWLSVEGFGFKRQPADEIPSSALPGVGIALIDKYGMVF